MGPCGYRELVRPKCLPNSGNGVLSVKCQVSSFHSVEDYVTLSTKETSMKNKKGRYLKVQG